MEPASWTTYYDNDYRDCDTGNPQVIYSLDPWDHTSGKKTRVQFQNLGLSGYGKHQLCVKYTHTSTGATAQRCLEFITEWIDMDLTGDSGGNKTFGNTMSFTATNVRTRYDSQPVLSNYLEKRCRIEPWSWIHYPYNDSGPSATLLRQSTWDNYWGYLGVLFGIKNTESAGDRVLTATVEFPNSCYLRDRDGSGDSSFYHHNCGWYHGINGVDKTVYCCGSSWSNTDTVNCDKFVVSDKEGGTLTITAHIDAKGDNYDDTRIYIECPGATAFGNLADLYTVNVSGVSYFWVNDMNYSTEKSFSEALPDSRYLANTSDFSCSNLKLNLCGKAYTYTELWNSNDVYGNKYTSPSSICVSGPECPHAICPQF